MQDRRALAFVLALVGGALALASAVLMGSMAALVFGGLPKPQGAAGLFVMLFGWVVLAGIVSAVVLLVAASRLRGAPEQEVGRWGAWAIAGGVVAALGGNLLAGGLGIGAGALVLAQPRPTATVNPGPGP
jgi:hypothetical protein